MLRLVPLTLKDTECSDMMHPEKRVNFSPNANFAGVGLRATQCKRSLDETLPTLFITL